MKIGIIGAGVAGPALAYWIHRNGHEPVLIEKAPRFRTGGYVIDFWGVGYTVAERMGILPQVHEAGYSIKELRIVNNRGRKVGGFPVDVFRRLTKERYTSLPRGDLAAVIYRTIENRVETIFGASVSAIEQSDSGVRAAFENGAPRDFDLLIGADGLHSAVRQLAFGAESQFEKHLGYWTAVFEVESYQPRDELVYVGYSIPGRQVARFSLRNNRTMFFFCFVDERMHDSPPRNAEERKAVLRRVFADAGWECPHILQAMGRAEDVYFDSVSQVRMNRWSSGRVMLIGDAGACVSLLAGEGSGLAMTEAYVLAGELHRAGGDYREAFRRQEERLRPFIEGKQKAAARFGAAFAPKTWAGVWIRNQATKLLVIPKLAEWLLWSDLRDDFDLPNYEM